MTIRFYDSVLTAANSGFQCAVYVNKKDETIVQSLVQDLTELKIETVLFEGKNFKTSSSNAQVKILVGEMKKDNEFFTSYVGHLQFVLSKLEETGYMIPMYYGIFPKYSNVIDILAYTTQNIVVSQSTPLHVTVLFVGGQKAKDINHYCLNKNVDMSVVGVSENEAGNALVISLPEHFNVKNAHITLGTNTGFKPVNVGEKISSENTTIFETPLVLSGVFLPFF